MTGRIDYATLMHDAMRGLIRRVLSDVARDGLPGEHHFFITFDPCHPGVEMADWLHARYPEEMTVVVQNWYEGLEVEEDRFRITLNFGNQPEPLEIPFAALRTFVDPSVEFGLRFETQEDMADDSHTEPEEGTEAADGEEADDTDDGAQHEADIVSIDSFRK